MTKKHTKTMLWKMDETFSHVSCILDAFLIFELDNIPTNTTSTELVCMVTVK